MSARGAALAAASLLALATVTLSSRAGAVDCKQAVADWASEGQGCAFEISHCTPGGVVVKTSQPARLSVELRKDADGFRKARGVSLSPVLDVKDWARVAPERREAFDRLVACVEAHPRPLPIDPAPPSLRTPSAALTPAPPAIPWRLLLGLALSLAAIAHRAPSKASRELYLALVALPLASLAAWRLISPPLFFHPNGQGPLWVEQAVLGSAWPSHYGPGFAELFGWLLSRTAPEARVLTANAMGLSLAPLVAWAVAHAAGVSLPLRWGLAALVGLSPLVARVAQSESYFAACTSLMMLAALPLAVACRDERLWLPRFAAAVVGAGLVASQAARVHPVAWAPLALVPLAAIARPAAARASLGAALVAAVGMAVVIAASSGGALLEVARGELFARWMPTAQALPQLPKLAAGALLMAGVVAAALGQRREVAAALSLSSVAALASATGLMQGQAEIYQRAYLLLFVAAALAPLCALLASPLRWVRAAAGASAVATWAFVCATTYTQATRPSTDALEQQLLVAWRRELPDDAAIVYVGRTGLFVFKAPFYASLWPKPVFELNADAGEPEARDGDKVFYYRSSLCDMPQAAPFCDEIDRTWRMKAFRKATLPARPSYPMATYRTGSIEVGLFHVD